MPGYATSVSQNPTSEAIAKEHELEVRGLVSSAPLSSDICLSIGKVESSFWLCCVKKMSTYQLQSTRWFDLTRLPAWRAWSGQEPTSRWTANDAGLGCTPTASNKHHFRMMVADTCCTWKVQISLGFSWYWQWPVRGLGFAFSYAWMVKIKVLSALETQIRLVI